MKRSGEESKMERKAVEKNRRMHMKGLCFKLSSLIPKQHICKEVLTQADQLDQAVSYIKWLKERIEKLKQKKMAMAIEEIDTALNGAMLLLGLGLPVIEVRHLGPVLEMVLITGLNKQFMFHELIAVLVEEGAEVLSANFSVVGDKIFHTIQSQAISGRIGLAAPRVSERLRELVGCHVS